MRTWTITVEIIPGSIAGTQGYGELVVSASNGLWSGQSGANPQIQAAWEDGTTTNLVDIAHALTVGTRYQIVYTYDGATVRSYVNGAAGTTAAVAGKTVLTSGVTRRILGLTQTIDEAGFTGVLKSVTIQQTAMGPADVAALYAGRDW
jgi:hypothetical protein